MTQTSGTVGLFLAGSRENRYQDLLARDAKDAAGRHGIGLEVFFSETLAAQQSTDVIRFLHSHSGQRTCVVIQTVSDIDSTGTGSLDQNAVHKLARRVAEKGVGWIVLNRDAQAQVAALRREYPVIPAGLVTPDQREFGRIQGRQFVALRPSGGMLLYVLGNPHSSSARDRRDGMRDVLGTALTVEEVDGYWSAAKAREAVARWLHSVARREAWPGIVGCQNDEMGLGAREALLQAAGDLDHPALRDVPVTGGDGLPDGGLRWVSEGQLAATIVMPSTAGLAIEQLATAWKTGQPMPSKTVLPPTPHPALDRLTARET